MVNFMRDPTGDIPWEEDPTAADVVHVDNKQVSGHFAGFPFELCDIPINWNKLNTAV